MTILTSEQKIKEATEKISECKKEVQQAKRIRKNRQGECFINKVKPVFVTFLPVKYGKISVK